MCSHIVYGMFVHRNGILCTLEITGILWDYIICNFYLIVVLKLFSKVFFKVSLLQGGGQAMVCMRRLENSLREFILAFHHEKVRPRNCNQVIQLGAKCLYLLNRLSPCGIKHHFIHSLTDGRLIPFLSCCD